MGIVTATEKARIEDVQAAHLAYNTLRMYRSGWAVWSRWIADRVKRGLPSVAFPADTTEVAAFLVQRADKVKVGTVIRDFNAIRYYHAQEGLDVVTPELKKTVDGLKRINAGRKQRQAAPLTPELLDRMRESFDVDRKKYALCELLFGGGLRVSEAASLTVGDVERLPNGGGRVLIRKSKSDQFGEGTWVKLPKRTMVALKTCSTSTRRTPLFETRKSRHATSPFTLTRWIRDAVKAVGEDEDDYSGHSGRVGFAVFLAERGLRTHQIARLGRWKRGETVERYLRGVDDDDDFFAAFE